MSSELRNSGIDAIGAVPWGTHLCLFYETPADLLDVLVSYFRAGLEDDEFCWWIVPAPLTRAEVVRAMQQAVPAWERYCAEDRIEIVERRAFSHSTAEFDLPRLLARLQAKLDHALARGCAGLRFNGTREWVDGRDAGALADLERGVDEFLSTRRMLIACHFALAESAASDLLDATGTHQFALVRRRGAWQMVETPAPDHAQQELERLILSHTQGLESAIEDLRKEIADRQHMEQDLRKQTELLQKIFDHVPMMILFYDARGNVEFANREWERIRGWTVREIKDQAIDFLAETFPDPREYRRAKDLIARAGGEWHDFRIRNRDGGEIDSTWAIVRLSDGSRVAIGRDVTARKRAEANERDQRALAEALRDTAAALNSTLDSEQVLDGILEYVERVVPHDTGAVLLLEGDHFRVARHRGIANPEMRAWADDLAVPFKQNTIIHHIVEGGQPLAIHDVQVVSPWEHMSRIPWVHSLVGAPIRIKGQVIGVITLQSSIPGFYSPDHAAHLQAFADQASVALENARLHHQVQASEERLQSLSHQLLVAQEAERRAIARELHDEIGQVLTAVNANLQAIQLAPDASTRAERLEESVNLIDCALRQIRDLSLDLRPSMLDDFGLVPALEWALERHAQRSGFSAEFVAEPPEMALPSGLATTCFRVAQIALTNVARHARAKRVRVELHLCPEELELVVRDDGIGFDPSQALEGAAHGKTLGLTSMQERVRLAGGEVEIHSAPPRGAEIRARFPLEPEQGDL